MRKYTVPVATVLLAAGMLAATTCLLPQPTVPAVRAAERTDTPSPAVAANVDRSPVDVILAPDGDWLITVNQTSNSVSLVDITQGKVLDEAPVGKYPITAALAPDGRRVLVTARDSGDVTILEVAAGKLVSRGRISVNFHPHGIVISPDGALAYVALEAVGQVAVVDLAQKKAVAQIDVGRWPRYLALTSDGSRLAVGVSGDKGVAVVDTKTREKLYLEDFGGLNIGHMQVTRAGDYVYFPWMHYGENVPNPSNIRKGWVIGNRMARVRLDGPALREAQSLDKEGEAVGDTHGLAISGDEHYLAISAGGTHELLVLRLPDLPYHKVGGTEHIDRNLLADRERFARIPVGGRPLGLRIAADNRTAYVANYLENSVQVVDLAEKELLRSIPLGGASEPSLARRGEAIFYDAKRSFDQWYSCHSCHYEGGTNSVTMDTLNDGSVYTFKTILPLFNVAQTPPWTWHGWQQSLDEAMRKSITSTMVGPEPTAEDIQALVEYLKTLAPPANPFRLPDGSLTEAAQRGREVFASEKAGCANCHTGPLLTDGQIHDVGLGERTDRYKGFNTPSLIGVYHKVRLLHNGRARSLELLLTGLHDPAKVTGQGSLSEDERRDLIEYLKSL